MEKVKWDSEEKVSTLEKLENFKETIEGMSPSKKEKAFLRTFRGEYFIKPANPAKPASTFFGIYGLPKSTNVAEITAGIFIFHGL